MEMRSHYAPRPASSTSGAASSDGASSGGASSRLQVSVSARTIWLVAGVAVLIVCVGIVLLKAALVFLLFFTGITLAQGIRPLVDRLRRLRVPRALAVLLVYAALVGILALLLWLLLTPLVAQVTGLITHLPAYLSRASDFLAGFQRRLGSNSPLSGVVSAAESSVASIGRQALPLLIGLPLQAGTTLLSIVLVAVIAFFWLTAVDELEPLLLSLFAEKQRPVVASITHDIGKRLGGYVVGVAVNMVVVGVLSGAADWLLGTPYPILLGIVAGMMEIIPYFGPWISGGVAVIVTLVALSPTAALMVALAYVIIQEIEGHVLIPFVMMRSVKLNPLTVVIAVLLGAEVLGIIGGILAVPAAAVVQVVVMRAIVPALQRRVSGVSAPEHPTTPHEGGLEADRRHARRAPHRQAPATGAPSAS